MHCTRRQTHLAPQIQFALLFRDMCWVKHNHTSIKVDHKPKLYPFHDRTVHVRGDIYRGPSLRILHTNDHFTPNSHNYNPYQLQGRSGHFSQLQSPTFNLHVNLSRDFSFCLSLILVLLFSAFACKRS